MIVLDEQIQDERISLAIARWYSGRVQDVTELRPGSVIKDDAIPGLLRGKRQPTFVTVNVSDFWRRMPAEPAFCVVAVDVPAARVLEVPELLRRLFRLPEFRTKAARMGRIVRVSTRTIDWYGPDGQIQSRPWPG